MANGYFGVPGPLRPVAEYLKRSAVSAFRKTIFASAARMLRARPASGRGGDRQRATELYTRINRKQAKQAKAALENSEFGRTIKSIERYAKSGDSDAVRIFLESLGSLGKIISVIVSATPNVIRAHQGVTGDMRTALDFIGSFADQPAVLQAIERVLTEQGAKVEWEPGKSPAERKRAQDKIGRGLNRLAAKHERQEERAQRNRDQRKTVDVNMGGGRVGPVVNRRFPKDHPIVTGDMIETPQSSNVYSFGYDLDVHTLYVRFKDRAKERPRPHRPGPIYAYYNIPPELFLGMMKASSKGGFIWDKFRVRGTVSGHQVDYSLVGIQGGYAARKATMTPRGEAYVPRTVYTDEGERVDSQLGFEYVRRQPLGRNGAPPEPNRGRGRNGRR